MLLASLPSSPSIHPVFANPKVPLATCALVSHAHGNPIILDGVKLVLDVCRIPVGRSGPGCSTIGCMARPVIENDCELQPMLLLREDFEKSSYRTKKLANMEEA